MNKGTLPGLSTEVIFQATGATNLNTTLGRDFSINKLTFASNATSPISISGNTLTIGAGGIEAQAGAGTGNHTINSNVGLAANQILEHQLRRADHGHRRGQRRAAT